MQRRSFLQTGAAAALAMHAPLWAQDKSPISIIMPVGGGTGVDTSTRILADVVSRELQRSVILENKPGADTMIATQHVLNGPTDGSRVLLISPSNMVLVPLVNKKLAFKPETQLQPVILSVRGGAALIVKAGRHRTLAEFVADAKANPGKLSVATYGGHYYKLLALLIQHELGIELNSVQYKDPAPAMADVVGGNVDAMVIDAGAAREFFRAGKTQILALTHESRPQAFLDVPTFRELGYPGLTAYVWIGYAVKAGTPPEVVQRLYRAFSVALKSPEYVSYMEKSSAGSELIDFDADKTRAYVQEERKRFAALIDKTGYTV
ncbi:tripartite tricarboxylate transporter substrate binding protein [Comamonas humi]